jgi:hypothetical protein
MTHAQQESKHFQFWATILVARAGRRRQGLSAMLHTIPEIGAIHLADDCRSAAGLLPPTDRAEVLVVIDGHLLDGGAENEVSLIKKSAPLSTVLLLVEQPKYEGLYKNCGADLVLLANASAQQLREVVRDLLRRKSV